MGPPIVPTCRDCWTISAPGRLDVIVVYKVDRLTRSLADFAKLVELFDAHGVSFVSVTQQFNTTTSMGRLTLNVLLSFAQFEREVTSERIRDKIAASKRKGLWVGGPLPLGYQMKDDKIAVVEDEAERVRLIFRRYLELGGVNALVRDLRSEISEPNLDCSRRVQPGAVFSSAVVRCSICCATASISARSNTRTRSCPASSRRSWIARYSMRFSRSSRINGPPGPRSRNASDHLLTGLLFDDASHRMVPTHATKAGIRYRYYVSFRTSMANLNPHPWDRSHAFQLLASKTASSKPSTSISLLKRRSHSRLRTLETVEVRPGTCRAHRRE